MTSLVVFEAAARQLSFTRAAAELGITQAAVSRQVQALEQNLGFQLFRRLHRSIELTERGQTLSKSMSEALGTITRTVQSLTAETSAGELVISASVAFSHFWLLPKISDFRRRHPEIRLKVISQDANVNLLREDVDIAIRYGAGRYPGLVTEHLMAEKIVPVCSPQLLTGDNPLKSPADLIHHTLLHDSSRDKDPGCPTWPMWLKAAGVCHKTGDRGLKFNQSSLVIEAAVAGKGVALAKATLALADLEAARLVIPFDLTTPTEFSYYTVHPPSKSSSPAVKAFKAWLAAEAAESADAADAQEAAA